MQLTAAAVAAAAEGELVAGDPARTIDGFSIDSRTLAAGDLFLAIRGERFDGHRFVGAAFDRGAVGVVVDDASAVARAPEGAIAIVVNETVVALQTLARHVRRASRAKVTAITGSAGKTTTKEAAAAFLERKYAVFRNRGNLNNHIGLPLSLLELRHGPDMAVVELGMNHAGEISTLVAIAEPEVRVWTNVGPAHLEFFASVDAIADAKAEIFEGARADDVLVANADDPLVMARARQFAGRVMTFGLASAADVRAVSVRDLGLDGIEAELQTPAGSVPLKCPLIGQANLANVLAAAAVALQFEIPLSDISTTTRTLRPMHHRGEVRRLSRGLTVIDDSYNSNPSALERAVRVVGGVRGQRRIAVIGEMLELGDSSIALHEQCGRAIAASGVDSLVTVGGEPARALGRAAVNAGMSAVAVVHAPTSVEAADVISQLVTPGDVVLVKGSRGIRTETVVERLVAEWA
ncbi:MAG: UDP-N-acetylmuramoyl-tripeptide--D-alanyl-D-alanine ligase [Vicinamibacterales bacterium]